MGVVMRGFAKTAVLAGFMSLFLGACAPSDETSFNASENSDNIIGGLDVDNGAPLSRNVVVMINMETREICSAALIGGTYAVTAAHCVDGEDLENIYVYFAAKPKASSERRQVVAAKVSPYWEMRQFEYKNTSDIAVIKFSGDNLPQGYEAAKFLEDDSILKNGVNSIILGYGVNNANAQTGAGVLRFTTLKISDSEFSPTEVLLDQSQGSGACHGDSGGPAFVYMKDSSGRYQYYLWGIANHSSKDDEDNLCNKSVIYTKATLFTTWMDLVKQSL